MLLPDIWGYYWGSFIPRCWSLVSLKWSTAAAGIFHSACDVFGSKWNNRLKTSLLRAVDTSSVSLRFKYSTAGCNNRTHMPNQDAFIYGLMHKLGEKIWISPTLASSQSSLTGDLSINQPQSHSQKGSILIIKHHCKFKTCITETDWWVLSSKRTDSCLYSTELLGPF